MKNAIWANITKPKEDSLTEGMLQGMSNIMQKYPGHTIDNFFGKNPITASQFMVLTAQLKYEYDMEKKEIEKNQKKSKSGRIR